MCLQIKYSPQLIFSIWTISFTHRTYFLHMLNIFHALKLFVAWPSSIYSCECICTCYGLIYECLSNIVAHSDLLIILIFSRDDVHLPFAQLLCLDLCIGLHFYPIKPNTRMVWGHSNLHSNLFVCSVWLFLLLYHNFYESNNTNDSPERRIV